MLDGVHLGFSHNCKNNHTNRFPTLKIYKKDVLHESLGQQDKKIVVSNILNPVAGAFSYFGGIHLKFVHLCGKYYYYDLNKSISYINAFKNEFHWESGGWNK